MCRLFGLTSNCRVGLSTVYGALCIVLQKLCTEYRECHGDGCGVAWFDNNTWHVKKFAEPLWESSYFRCMVDDVEGCAVVVHARKATFHNSSLGPRVENSHPYVYEENGAQFVFAHNGHIVFDNRRVKVDVERRVLRVDGFVESLTSYGVDSEVFFRLLVHRISACGGDEPESVLCALEDLLADSLIKDFSAINFIMGTNKFIYVFRYYNECCPDCGEKYTLYYIVKNQNRGCGELREVLISSEPLTSDKWINVTRRIAHVSSPEDWVEIKNRNLLYMPIGKPENMKIAKLRI